MQEYRVICKSDRGFLNAVLAAAREDTMLEINESQRELVIPDLEAYRTGIPEIRKILKPGEVMLRAQYFEYADYRHTTRKNVDKMTTGTQGNLKKIDTAYQKGAYLNLWIPTKKDMIYIGSDFKIIFLGPNHVPTIRYKPIYISRSPVDMGVQEFVEVYHGYVWHFGSDHINDMIALCEVLPKLIKYSP